MYTKNLIQDINESDKKAGNISYVSGFINLKK